MMNGKKNIKFCGLGLVVYVSNELHRVYDKMLQRAQKCIDVQGDHFQHLL